MDAPSYSISAKGGRIMNEKAWHKIMKEYRVIKVSEKEAEAVMNRMARDGWKVTAVTYWSYWWVHLLVTFERDIE